MPFLPTGQGILIILYLLYTQYTLTIIVPVVYIARDVMIFNADKYISRAIGRGGP